MVIHYLGIHRYSLKDANLPFESSATIVWVTVRSELVRQFSWAWTRLLYQVVIYRSINQSVYTNVKTGPKVSTTQIVHSTQQYKEYTHQNSSLLRQYVIVTDLFVVSPFLLNLARKSVRLVIINTNIYFFYT